jgi:hypothetical protein
MPEWALCEFVGAELELKLACRLPPKFIQSIPVRVGIEGQLDGD